MIEHALAIRFLLNDRLRTVHASPSSALLDAVRGSGYYGTKEGCREGDCGTCVVLVGRLDEAGNAVEYRARNSCLLPLGEIEGCHVVTVEGLERTDATDDTTGAIQRAIVEEGASQCGFCTPGFVVSLAGCFLNSPTLSREDLVEAMEGNICRCTGYLALIRAAGRVATALREATGATNGLPSQPGSVRRIEDLVRAEVLPAGFETAADRLRSLRGESDTTGKVDSTHEPGRRVLAGGTDLLVQLPDDVPREPTSLVTRDPSLSTIRVEDDRLVIGGSVRMEELKRSAEYRKIDPSVDAHLQLIASQPIRESATLAGNLVNASPIGDMTVQFLALGAELELAGHRGGTRIVPLREFYRGYKDTDLTADEIVASIRLPRLERRFAFEKVSRRTHLDIASVNVAVAIEVDGDRITSAGAAAGGVAPVPLFLERASSYLNGKSLDPETLLEMLSIADAEASPISDVRGSAAYKRLLLRQLLIASLLTLFPDARLEEVVA